MATHYIPPLLPINSGKCDDYIPLSHEKLSSTRNKKSKLKILVIDVISMVGADQFSTIHRRRCDIMGNTEPFGGVSILVVGDLLQLPPVMQKPIYKLPTDDMACLYGSLWKENFEMVELTEIVRQNDDSMFAELLNRVRTGEQTDDNFGKQNCIK